MPASVLLRYATQSGSTREVAEAALMGFDPAAKGGLELFLHADDRRTLAREVQLGTNRVSEIWIAGPAIQTLARQTTDPSPHSASPSISFLASLFDIARIRFFEVSAKWRIRILTDRWMWPVQVRYRMRYAEINPKTRGNSSCQMIG